LVRYLLAHDDRARALSELLSLSGNLPDEAGPHVEAGALFLEAGDAGRALDHFRRALRRDAASRTALAGAGDAAFELADYAAARRFLRAAALAPSEPQFSRLHERLQIADLVLERDPLRPRLPPGQRWERLTSMVRHASQRLEVCLTRATLDPPTRDALASLREELVQWRAEQRRRPARSLEPLEAGVSLVDRIEEGTATCAPADPLDRALQLIARRHEIDRQ
jgi:tetratricopeptide (TPR) repeat protein